MMRACTFVLLLLAACNEREVCGATDVGGDGDVRDGCEALAQTSDESSSGLAICEDDRVVRFDAVACSGCVDVILCRVNHDDCGDCPAPGICAEGSLGACFCYVPCASDDECGDGFACICPSGGGATSPRTGSLYPQCVPAACATTENCTDGNECVLSADACGAPSRLDCTTADDACGACEPGEHCAFDGERFACEASADCG